MSKFDSGRFSGTRGSRDDGFREVHGFTTKLHEGQQGKHIIGHNNYMPGRSVLHMTMAHAQELVETYGGTGDWIGTNRERVDFGFVIGTYVHDINNIRQKTTRGIIHYSHKGAHIVPSEPRKEDR